MNRLKHIILGSLIFLFPLFFAPLTQEYFITQKLYFLAFGVLLLLVISAIEFFVDRRVHWKWTAFDGPLLFFLIAIILSIIFASPNKIQALLDPYLGFVSIFSLILFFFYLSRSQNKKASTFFLQLLQYSALVISVLAVVFFFSPFKNIALPSSLAFLRSPSFTPIGTRLDLAVFIGFFLVLSIVQLVRQRKHNTTTSVVAVFIHALALVLTAYTIFKPETQQQTLLFPPYRLSWVAAIEILKIPVRFFSSQGTNAAYDALFGVGVNNFSSIFTRIKDLAYNQSPLWQVNSFNVSRSGILQIFTEAGLLGAGAFAFLVFTVIRTLKKLSAQDSAKPILWAAFFYLLFVLALFPISLIVLFLFFLTLALIADEVETEDEHKHLGFTLPVGVGIAAGIVLLIFVAAGAFFLSRSYLAEYQFKTALNGVLHNNLKELYDNQRLALETNPYMERFHSSFSQTNLFVANSIVNAKQRQSKNGQINLNTEERQQISQAVQTAINDGRAAVILNPQRAENWQNWAEIYRSILTVVQGADSWTASTYQRAIFLDPGNPIYRLNLGSVYYSLQDYNDAGLLFIQTVNLKPDWANAHYNLAWTNYQLKQYQNAANEMQNVLRLLDRKTNANDYDKAQKELEVFKKKIPEAQQQTATAEPSQGSLQLPQNNPEVSPKLQLNPKEASPQAR